MKTFLEFLKESELTDLKSRLRDKEDLELVGDFGYVYRRKNGWTFWYKGLDKPSPYTYPNQETAIKAIKQAHEIQSRGLDTDTTSQEFQDDFMGPQGKVFKPVVGAQEVEEG